MSIHKTTEFVQFKKIPRLFRDIVITEKLDGTNAQILVTEDGSVLAGSRNRWLTPDNDNFGFARWVMEHEDELRGLGHGHHFGEWWGCGIQRGYHLNERRFSLFNTGRWYSAGDRPACCGVVPILYSGPFNIAAVHQTLSTLRESGSVASPGFLQPEGVVVYHTASRETFKVTLENDDVRKSELVI